jgi:hypothetical protein
MIFALPATIIERKPKKWGTIMTHGIFTENRRTLIAMAKRAQRIGAWATLARINREMIERELERPAA